MALPTDTTPVAKSLHTLKVLQQVSEVFRRIGGYNDPETALAMAWTALGFTGRPDPHGLRDRALFLMTRDAKQ